MARKSSGRKKAGRLGAGLVLGGVAVAGLVAYLLYRNSQSSATSYPNSGTINSPPPTFTNYAPFTISSGNTVAQSNTLLGNINETTTSYYDPQTGQTTYSTTPTVSPGSKLGQLQQDIANS